MKKYFGVFLALLLLMSMIPAPGGAGMLRYDLGKSTFAPSLTETEAVTFVAPGSGSVVLPEATLSATEGDGFVARILKEGNEVVALAVDGGETATMPETKLAVAEGDEITFEADTRGMDGDILTWSPVVLYQGGIAEAEAAPYFIDLANHWSKPYVMPLAEAGIVSGKTANTYDPDGQITRAEFLTLALKVADLPVQVYMPSYADVQENQWFSKVAYVAQKGEIVDPNMVVDNKLLPDQPILREEMTAVIMRVLKVMRGTTIDGAHSFTDGASFAAWASDYIGQAAKLGIVTGNPDGSFNAKGNATRGEAAVMFSRLKDYLDKTPLFTPHGEYSPVYGAIVYEDVDLNKVINDQIAAGVKEITVAPGAYRLKSQPRGGHIALYDVEGVTINGYGVSILGQTTTTNIFKLENCKDVTINGFTNDYEGGCIFQGQIYNIDPDGFFFDVTVEPGMIQDTKKFITTGMMGSIYEGETGQIVLGTETIMIEPKKMERLSSNTFRINGKKVAGQPGIEVGDYVGAWGYANASNFGMTNCENIALNDINVWSGMCTINFIQGPGPLTLNNVYVGSGAKHLGTVSPRIPGVHGDGLHMTANRNGPIMNNCTFENLLDDGINLHGSYGKVAGIEGDTLILSNKYAAALYREGDRLRLFAPDATERTPLTITSIRYLDSYTPGMDLKEDTGVFNFSGGGYMAVKVKEKIDAKVGDWMYNYDITSSNYEIKNSTFRNSRSNAMVIHSGDGIIENCIIARGGSHGLNIIPGLDWGESGFVENLTIKNCQVYDNGWLENSHSGGICIHGDTFKGQNHKNITIEGCTFYNNFVSDLYISEVKNVVAKNNTFKPAENNATATIRVNHADNVTLSGNKYVDGRTKNTIQVDRVTNFKEN